MSVCRAMVSVALLFVWTKVNEFRWKWANNSTVKWYFVQLIVRCFSGKLCKFYLVLVLSIFVETCHRQRFIERWAFLVLYFYKFSKVCLMHFVTRSSQTYQWCFYWRCCRQQRTVLMFLFKMYVVLEGKQNEKQEYLM